MRKKWQGLRDWNALGIALYWGGSAFLWLLSAWSGASRFSALIVILFGGLVLHLALKRHKKALQLALQQSQGLLQQSEKLTIVGEMAAGIAHEIRNPLTSLRGFVQLLLHNQLPEPNHTYAEIMLTEIDRISVIVNELLLLAKPKEMHVQPIELPELLETVVTLMNAQAILQNVELKTEFPPLPVQCKERKTLTIAGEENKLKQVFINLLKNAIEAMPQGGLIRLVVERHGKSQVLIRIIDQGGGIPKELLPKLGQAFVTNKEQGTGLGLMISNSIIENHQGTLQIESEEGHGTTVAILLPLVR